MYFLVKNTVVMDSCWAVIFPKISYCHNNASPLFSSKNLDMEKDSKRVLSIQSHVVSGYVGNKSAIFPLQVLGFEVDYINSVQYSNHPGYGFWKGEVVGKRELDDLMKALLHNGIANYSHLLTGYVADPGFLSSITQIVKELKKVNPSLIYVCDPVMGDNGMLYVPEDLVQIYKKEIVCLADVITPNQFELETLSERPINSMSDALKAIDTMHELGVEIVFLSSSSWGEDDHLVAIVSKSKNGQKKAYKITIPRMPARFTGTGDLATALFLAWYSKTGDLQVTLENTVATLSAVLKRTFQTARQTTQGDNLTVGSLELRIIQSKADIESPTCTLTAEPIDV